MSKTLVIILNHNLPEYTNRLFDSLQEFQGETYETIVMDNGSKPELMAATTHIRFENNLYFGGALNEAFKLVLQDEQYDSLLFLNNDIEVTTEVFVNLLRNELFSNDFAILSPCIAGRAQPWKQMQNWGSRETRIVKWIDLQAPLFHRKLIETIGQFDPDLYYGWGQELVCFDLCEEKGWTTGVCDHICILHFGKQTLLQNRLFSQKKPEQNGEVETVSLTDSHAMAMYEYRAYFTNHPLKHGDFEELRAYGEHYTFL
ncbi:MAG: glycosyltransferase [Bacteroidales bacterium]|nr:glycosyltransferase [Bacteroidales bacterium]